MEVETKQATVVDPKKAVFSQQVKTFSQQAYTSKPGKGLQLFPQSDSESDESIDGETPEEALRRKEKRKAKKRGFKAN